MVLMLRLFNMNSNPPENIELRLMTQLDAAEHRKPYFAHTGVQFLPAVVNCLS